MQFSWLLLTPLFLTAAIGSASAQTTPAGRMMGYTLFPAYRHCADFDPADPIDTAQVCFEKLTARIEKLRTADPEIYDLILRNYGDHDVDGGFTLSVGSANLDCDDGIDGGFERCTTSVRVEVRSHGGSADHRSANVEIGCNASISYETANGGSSKSASSSESLHVSSGSSDSREVEIDFDFLYGDPAIRAQITSATCAIDDIT